MIHYVAVDKKHCLTPFPYQSVAKSTNDCLICTKKNLSKWTSKPNMTIFHRRITIQTTQTPCFWDLFLWVPRWISEWTNPQSARLGLAPKVEKGHLSAAVWASSTSKNNRLLYLMLIVYFPIFRGVSILLFNTYTYMQIQTSLFVIVSLFHTYLIIYIWRSELIYVYKMYI